MLSKINLIEYSNYKNILEAISYPETFYKYQLDILVSHLSTIPDTPKDAPVFIIGFKNKYCNDVIKNIIKKKNNIQIYYNFYRMYAAIVDCWLIEFKYFLYMHSKTKLNYKWDFKRRFKSLFNNYNIDTLNTNYYELFDASFDYVLLLRVCFPEAKIIFLENENKQYFYNHDIDIVKKFITQCNTKNIISLDVTTTPMEEIVEHLCMF